MSFEAARENLQRRRDAVTDAERTVRELGTRIAELEARREALERGVQSHRLPPVAAADEGDIDVESTASVEARIEELRSTYEIQKEALAGERAEVATISEELLERIREGPFAALDDDVPIALLPVRLETRYDASANDLLVRVYPDQIHLDSHEPGLTAEEIDSAREFWQAVYLSGKGDDVDTPLLASVVGEDAWRYNDAELLRVAVTEHATALRGVITELDAEREEAPIRWRDDGTVVDIDDFGTVDIDVGESDDPPTEAEVRHAARCREAWKRLADEFGPERAGWIVRAYRPAEASTLLSVPFEDREVELDLPADDDIERREESWTRPPHAALLPDFWTVSLYVDDLTDPVRTAEGAAIVEDLALGPTPGEPGKTLPSVVDEATDEGLRWAVDFDAAVEVGMGIRVDLDDVIDPDDPPEHRVIDRLVVTGIKTTMDAQAGAEAVKSLFEAHQYTDGLAFLPQGTPTNNTETEAAGARDAATRVDRMAALACGEPVCLDDGSLHRTRSDTDGELLAKALGITPSALGGGDDHVFGRTVGADGTEQRDARHMNALLWEGTWGNYIRHLLPPDSDAVSDLEASLVSIRTAGLGVPFDGQPPILDDRPRMRRLLGTVQGYQHHFIDYVRARGPLPTLRVGNQPYGVLPTTSYDADIDFDDGAQTDRAAWRRSTPSPRLDYDGIGARIQRRVDAVSGTWRSAAWSTPRLGRDDATVADLYDVLSSESTGFGVFAADLVADDALGDMLFEYLRLQEEVDRHGFDPDRDPRDPDDLPWGGGDIDPLIQDFLGPLIDEQTSVEDLRVLLTGTMREVMESGVIDRVHNIQTDGGVWATDIVGQPAEAGLEWLPKVALFFGVGSQYLPLTPTRYEPPKTTPDGRERPPTTPLVAPAFRSYLETFLTESPKLSETWGAIEENDLLFPLLRYSLLHAYLAADIRQGYLSGGDYRYTPPSADEFEVTAATRHPTPDDLDLREVVDGLEYFRDGEHSPEMVGRLLTETLDLASHRHDAWQTSLVTRRLDELRARRTPGENGGLHVGGYGWIEDLRLDGAPSTHGFVDGPSLDHATTAAILRNGYLEYYDRVGEDAPEDFEAMAELLSVSLTSRRVRLGRQLLQGVRNGQRPSDLLGYRFERTLHDHGPEFALDRFVGDFRRAYPPDDWEPPEDDEDAVPPVVNGRPLAEAWRRRGAGVFTADGLEDLRSSGAEDERNAVTAALDDLFESLDAVRDLLLAEAVHQLATGDTTRAAAALDALRGEGAPPDLDVVRTPRRAQSVTHRVLLLFDPNDEPQTAWPTGRDGDAIDGPNVRGFAEPTLDSWAGSLLGDPSKAVCLVEYAAGPDEDATVFETNRVSLADLGLSPLDVLALVSEESAAGADFEAYVRYHLGPTTPDAVPADATVRLTTGRFDGLAADERSLAETFEFARAIRTLVASARPATGRDLALPDEGAREYVTAQRGRLGVRARALDRDASAAEATLSALYSCLTGEPHPDDPETEVLGLDSLADLVAATETALDDGARAVVSAVSDVDVTTLDAELGEVLAVVADLEAEHTDRPPVLSAVTARLAGRSFPKLARLRSVPAVDYERLAATLDAVEAAPEGRDGTPLETLLTADATPLRTETFDELDEQDVTTARTAVASLAPDLPKLSDDVRTLVETLTDLAAMDRFLSLGAAPDEDVWAALSLADIRAELTAVRTALDDEATVSEAQFAAGRYDDLFGAIDALAAHQALAPVRGAIQRDLRALLFRLSYYGVDGAVPAPADDAAPATTDAELVAQVAGVRDIVRERLGAAADALGADPTTANYVESIEALLGEAFVVLPPFAPPDPKELRATFEAAHHATLTGGDDVAVDTWFHRMARVRDGVDRLRRTYTYAEALSDDVVRELRVGQLPFAQDDRWVALPTEDERDVNGKLSLVVGTDAAFDDADTLTGLFVDEWVEAVPEPTTTAGVSFQYDAPGSRAPQSVLLAVPPNADGWDEEVFQDTVVGTFELAKRRTVDFNETVVGDARRTFGSLDRLFPALGVLGVAGPGDPPIELDLSDLYEVNHE